MPVSLGIRQLSIQRFIPPMSTEQFVLSVLGGDGGGGGEGGLERLLAVGQAVSGAMLAVAKRLEGSRGGGWTEAVARR